MLLTEKIETPVVKTSDVLVAGGGIAGIASALAAARQGKMVVLVERGFMLGGLATAGLIAIYLPLCDGYGKQVSFGIAEELLRLSVSMYCDGKRGAAWLEGQKLGEKDPRFEVNFNPQLMAILSEQLLLKEGVEIIYGAYVAGCVKDGDRLTHAVIEGKSGRQAIAAKSFVDATGDCDLAALSGTPTLNFQQGNILASWYYSFGSSGYELNMLGYSDIPDEEKKLRGDIVKRLSERRYAGLEMEEVSQFVVDSHSSMLNAVKKKQTEDSSYQPVTIPTVPQLRMTRRIDGEYTLATDEQHRYFEDSIGMVSDWRKRGPVYEIPFRTLYSSKCRNLICAGRCTSVTDGMWDIMRVIPCCAVTGEAAGIAAAMTDDFTTLNVSKLQQRLIAAGAVIHER